MECVPPLVSRPPLSITSVVSAAPEMARPVAFWMLSDCAVNVPEESVVATVSLTLDDDVQVPAAASTE